MMTTPQFQADTAEPLSDASKIGGPKAARRTCGSFRFPSFIDCGFILVWSDATFRPKVARLG